MSSDGAAVTSGDRLFQIRGPVIGKALSPTVNFLHMKRPNYNSSCLCVSVHAINIRNELTLKCYRNSPGDLADVMIR